MPTRATPSSVKVSCSRGIGMSWVAGMSCSNECLLGDECGLVQVASCVAQRGGLVVAHDRYIYVQAGLGEVLAGRGHAVAVDRCGRQSEPGPAVPEFGTVAGGPWRGGERLDGVD